MFRDVLIAICAGLFSLTLLVVAENTISQSFQSCISQTTAQQGAQGSNKNGQIIAGVIKAQVTCSVSLVDRHAGFFAALATLAIACFTLTLWLATHKLWLASENTAKRQLRAYVFVVNAERISHHVPALGTRFEVKNTGQTPAYDVFISIGAKFDGLLLTSPPPKLKKEDYSFAIGPGKSITHTMIADPVLAPDEMEAINHDAGKLFIIGRIDYRDTFGQVQYTEFQVEYGHDSMRDGALRLSGRGLRAS